MNKVLLSILMCSAATAAMAQEAKTDTSVSQTGDRATLEEVVVQAARVSSNSATGLNLSLRETPQSVSVVNQEQIKDFGLVNVNDLLAQVTGINVEKVETDRTYFNSRGFDITNFQVDGVGLPLIWGIQFGDLDTAIFDRVEAIRGADSMMTGTGNPSATINYVRKRPTKTFQATANVSYGSWDEKRFEGDVSGALNESGSVTGRLVYANEDKDSYLDYYSVNRNVYYGILSWDATSKLNITGGYSLQDNRSRGVLWGALPLTYSDGTFIDYPVSASTSADWTYWNVRDQSAFGEATYKFDGGWQIKGVGTYKQFDELAKLLYAYGYPDPVTGLGVVGMTGIYPSRYQQYMLDVTASGPFNLFGREHELVVGANVSQSSGREQENFATVYPSYPAVSTWGTQQIAEPSYPGAYLAADGTDRLYRIYAAAHLNVTDSFKTVVGFNALKLKTTGYSYGTDTSRNETAASPYIGATYDVTSQISLYASYTDIFNPQSQVDVTHQKLPSAHGQSYEFGVKSEWFGKRLYATASIFKSEQAGLAEYAGTFMSGQSYYKGVDTFVTGYELEATGKITDDWSVTAGWTQLSIKDAGDMDARTYLPRSTLKLSSTYVVPSLRNLKVGASLRWQDSIYIQDLVTIPQDAYAVLDLMSGIDVTDKARLTLNLKNVTNEKYLTSLMWNQSYYAAPRSVVARLEYTF